MAAAPPSGPAPIRTYGRCSLRLLGGFTLEWGGQLLLRFKTRRALYLLAYLALHRDQYRDREELAGLLWPDSDWEKASNSLANALLEIRRAFGEVGPHAPSDESQRTLHTERVGIRFAPPSGCHIDAVAFQALASEALRPGVGGEQKVRLLEAAVDQYGGSLLPGCTIEWFEERRRYLEQQYADCLRALVEACKARRQPARVVEWARQALRIDSLDELLHQEVMRQLAATGDRGGMIRQFEECRRCLAAEDLEPTPETVTLYEHLLNPTPVPGAAAPPPRLDLEGPFIGRDVELSRLWQTWGATAHGVGELVFVSGESGIGKSRLGTELLNLVEHAEGLAVHGQATHPERGLLYQPLIDALRMAIAQADHLGLELGTSLVLAHVARLLPELRERFPDLPPVGSGEETDLFDALCRFFHDLARQRRLCLFMDDLHWADDASLRFLQYLWRRSTAVPLLLVGAFRDSDAQENSLLIRWRRAVEARRPETRLALPLLSGQAVDELLKRLAGGGAGSLPAGFARLLHQETGGNPLHLQLTLRSLFEEEWLTRDEAGNWQPGPRMPDPSPTTGQADLEELFEHLPLFASIREWIMERLERLGEQERQFLEAAAVLGQTLDPDLLGRVAADGPEMDLEALDRLLTLDLLRETTPGKLGFTHDRIREVVYGSLSLLRRQALHLRAGTALEERLGARAAELPDRFLKARLGARAAELADHFLKAPQPRAAEPAARYLHAAGDAARCLFAHGEAVRHLEAALEVLDTLPGEERQRTLRRRVVHELSRAYRGYGDPDRGEALLVEFIQQCRIDDLPVEEAHGCHSLAAYLWVGQIGPRDLGRIETLYQQCLGLCARHGLDTFSVRPRLDLLLFYLALRPNLPAAERLAVELARDLDRLDRHDVREALTLLMGLHGKQGRWEEAKATFFRSLEHGGPQQPEFHLALGWLAVQAEREGRQEWFAALCRGWQARALALGCTDLPGQWFLEPAEPVAPSGRLLLDARFAEEPMPPELVWVDPLELGGLTWTGGCGLTLAPPSGLDLWPESNLNAPRLLLPVVGDFVAETRVEIGGTGAALAGLVLWESDREFVRLDRVCTETHGDGVSLGACSNYRYAYLGQGSFTTRKAWLRLERKGKLLRGLCSVDRDQWWVCGSGTFAERGPIQVGILCVAFKQGATASFERFTVWTGDQSAAP